MRVPTAAITTTTIAVMGICAAPSVAADGDWFAPHQTTSVPNGMGPGPAPRGTVAADFTGDGVADIVTIANFTFGNLLLAPGNGDGTFGSTSEIPGTTQVQGIDAGDINDDGANDVVAMTTSEVRIRLGDGSGSFRDGGSYSMSLGGQVEPRVADVDGDGDLDILAPSFTAIKTLINAGDGTFGAGPSSPVGGAGALSAIDTADLDGDGNADLFAVDGFSGTTFALRGDGAGRFAVSGRVYGSGLVPEDVTAIDLDDDGYDDAAVVGSFSFSIATARTDGRGRFRTSVVEALQYGGPGPTSAAAEDFDGDGRTDLVVSSLATPAPSLLVFAGNGTAKMRKVDTFPVGIAPQNPVVSDFDADGDLDIVTAGPGALSFLANTTP